MTSLAPVATTSRWSRMWGALNRQDKRSLAGMFGFIVLLHVVGFGVLVTLVIPQHFDLGSTGIEPGFDVIVSAGNVMAFLAPSTRPQVLSRLRAHLAGDGRAAIGFGAGRDYQFAEFLDDAAQAGFAPDLLLSTWDLRQFTDDSDFLVAILRPA